MSYSLLVFDFDGTLADTLDLFASEMQAAAAHFGFDPPDPARREHYRSLGTRELLRELRIPAWKLPAITLHMRHRMQQRIDEVRLFDGAHALLRDLRRHGIRTAIVSSNATSNVERVLGPKYTAMIDHFACGSSILGKRRHLRATLKAFDFTRDRVLCIGDETRDAEAAASLRIDFVGVGWGQGSIDALAPLSSRPPFSSFAQILDAAIGD